MSIGTRGGEGRYWTIQAFERADRITLLVLRGLPYGKCIVHVEGKPDRPDSDGPKDERLMIERRTVDAGLAVKLERGWESRAGPLPPPERKASLLPRVPSER
jgi:hypothetical protein